jgi:hypothetical protein
MGRIRNIVMSAHKWGGDGHIPNFRKIRATLIAKHPEVIAKAFGGDPNRAAGWIKARWYQLRGRPVPGTRGEHHLSLVPADRPVIRVTRPRPVLRVHTDDPTLLALGWLPASVKRSDLDAGDFAVPETRQLPYKIHGKVNEAGWRAAWSAINGARSPIKLPAGVTVEAVKKRLLANKPKGIEVAS